MEYIIGTFLFLYIIDWLFKKLSNKQEDIQENNKEQYVNKSTSSFYTEPDKETHLTKEDYIELEAQILRSKYNYQNYLDYIQNNPRWQNKRLQRLEIDKYICQSCGKQLTSQTAHIHHVNYNSLFNENMNDIISLCPPCHEKEHN